MELKFERHSSISNEVQESDRIFKRSRSRLEFLASIYPSDFTFPFEIPTRKRKHYRPSLATLKDHYYNLCLELEAHSKEQERTPAERRLKRRLASNTQMNIRQSVWIGSHCFDLFIPNVRSIAHHPKRVMRGLAIEVDGDCHNREDKMRKDEAKENRLLYLGIGVVHIENWDFSQPTAVELQKRVGTVRRLDSRERRRLWRRIYSFTLAMNLSEEAFFRLFEGAKSD